MRGAVGHPTIGFISENFFWQLVYYAAESEFVLVREIRFYSLFLESMTMVTGPSLTRLTFMSAPNSPV